MRGKAAATSCRKQKPVWAHSTHLRSMSNIGIGMLKAPPGLLEEVWGCQQASGGMTSSLPSFMVLKDDGEEARPEIVGCDRPEITIAPDIDGTLVDSGPGRQPERRQRIRGRT